MQTLKYWTHTVSFKVGTPEAYGDQAVQYSRSEWKWDLCRWRLKTRQSA